MELYRLIWPAFTVANSDNHVPLAGFDDKAVSPSLGYGGFQDERLFTALLISHGSRPGVEVFCRDHSLRPPRSLRLQSDVREVGVAQVDLLDRRGGLTSTCFSLRTASEAAERD